MPLTKELVEAEILKMDPVLGKAKEIERMLKTALAFLQNGGWGSFGVELTDTQKDVILADYQAVKTTFKTMVGDL